MRLYSNLKKTVLDARRRLKENTLDSVVWIVDTFPSFCGFSIQGGKISPWFWLVHLFLLFYVYGVGIFVYQWKHANGVKDFIKSYINISLVIIIANHSWWWLTQRKILKETLKNIASSDKMARHSTYFQEKHKNFMKLIKRIVLIFFACNATNAVFIYLPNRVDIHDNFSMTLCVGLEPLTAFPNRQICLLCLALEELAIMVVVLNYQVLLLFLITHTAAMYEMLAYEMEALNDNDKGDDTRALANEMLPLLISRHTLTLTVTDQLRDLYSAPLGVNFFSNAVCISLFFYLSLEECVQFIPVVFYCFLVFFLYCFLCQRLINASEMFARSVYCCGWENFHVPEKKLVYTMLLQAQKPVEILAADIIPVNIYTFATTMQAIYKFVTVMKI